MRVCFVCKKKEGDIKSDEGISLHRIPMRYIKQKWMKVLECDSFKPTKHTFICSLHFENRFLKQYGSVIKLVDGACPSLFLDDYKIRRRKESKWDHMYATNCVIPMGKILKEVEEDEPVIELSSKNKRKGNEVGPRMNKRKPQDSVFIIEKPNSASNNSKSQGTEYIIGRRRSRRRKPELESVDSPKAASNNRNNSTSGSGDDIVLIEDDAEPITENGAKDVEKQDVCLPFSESMPALEVNNMCVGSVKSGIKLDELCQEQSKEITRLRNEIITVYKKLSLCRLENAKLQGQLDAKKKPTLLDASVQVTELDFPEAESEYILPDVEATATPNKHHKDSQETRPDKVKSEAPPTRTPKARILTRGTPGDDKASEGLNTKTNSYLRVRQFSAGELTEPTNNNVNFVHLPPTMPSANLPPTQGLFYIIPNFSDNPNHPMIVNSVFPNNLPSSAVFQTSPMQINNDPNMFKSTNSSPFLTTPTYQKINISDIKTEPKSGPSKKSKYFNSEDIEDDLPHAIITYENDPAPKPKLVIKSKSNPYDTPKPKLGTTPKSKPRVTTKSKKPSTDKQQVQVFTVVKSIDLTEDKGPNQPTSGNVPAASTDSVDQTLPSIVSTVSLAPTRDTPDTQTDMELPCIVSVESLSQKNTDASNNKVVFSVHTNKTPQVLDVDNTQNCQKAAECPVIDLDCDSSSSDPAPPEAQAPVVIRRVNFGINRMA